jgi:glycosyltransferase involved in cell wall biosynthesis
MVTYHFPPSAASGSFRLLGFARHLPKYGWRTIVVAPPRLPWEAVDPELSGQVPSETIVYPVRHDLKGPIGLFLKFHAPISPWLPKAWWACIRAIHRHKPDVLLTSGPPQQVHLLGLVLKRQFGIPWVADFRDPWVVGMEQGPGKASTPTRGRDARFEAAVMRSADAVVANAPRARDLIRGSYPDSAEKMHAVTNGYDPEAFTCDVKPRGLEQRCRLVHTGQLYGGRDPRPFLEAVVELERDRPQGYRPLQVHFIGNLDSPDCNVSNEIRSRGLDRVVTIDGVVPYQQSLREMMRSDILLLLDSAGRLAGVPAKVYEYIGARRPILALGESAGDLAWVLRESGRLHRIAPLIDRERIKQALIELQAEPPAAFAEASSAATVFTRDWVAGELAKVLDQCARGGPRMAETQRGEELETAPIHDPVYH